MTKPGFVITGDDFTATKPPKVTQVVVVAAEPSPVVKASSERAKKFLTSR